MQPYERFAAWQHAHALVLLVYRATEHFPTAERFGLVSQIRRAAFSAAANIVEGSARKGTGEFRRFLDFAWSSLVELSYALRLAHALGYLNDETYQSIEGVRAEAARTTWGLYRSVRDAA